MRNSPALFSRPAFLIILLFLIIGVVYSPVLYFDYVFHDDTTFWIKLKEYGFKHYYYNVCINECRNADALLISLENFFVHKVSDLRFLRFLAIVISSCNGFLLLQQLRRLSFSNIQAFLIITPIFFLPGFADIFSCGEYASIIALSIFLACWSFHRIEAGQGILISIFSFLFTITIYPPAAMFYWTVVGMHILFVRDRFSPPFRNLMFRSMIAGLLGLLCYAILILLMHYCFLHQAPNSFYNPYAVSSDVLTKLKWFFQEPLCNALNLWNIFPKTSTSIIISGFIAITILVVITSKLVHNEPQKRKEIFLTYLWQLCLFIFVVFMTFLPNFAAQGNAAYYRCLIPLTSLVWLVWAWSILKWMDIFPLILTRWAMIALFSTIVVYAGLKTYHNVLHYRVLPSYIEWNAYKSMAEKIRLKKVDAIYILLPYQYQFPLNRYDEFNVLTSDFKFDIYHLIYCAFNEIGVPSRPFPSVYISYPGGYISVIKEIYYRKLPNGKEFWKNVNKENQILEMDSNGNSSDYGLFPLTIPLKVYSKDKNWHYLYKNDFLSLKIRNWYFLNLDDLLSLSHYESLIKQD